MAIEVGINSYITLDEAEEIIKTLISTSQHVSIWNSLSDEDKEAVIINTIEKYDNNAMNYIGFKQDRDQNLQFPRIVGSDEILECPYKVKKGYLLQGLNDLITSDATSSSIGMALKSSGIKQFEDGSGASITFASAYEMIYNKLGSGIDKDIFDMYFSDYTTIGKIRWL